MTIRAIRAGLEDDGRVDIGLPGERSPFRVLVYETRLSWPATFVRRSLEGEPAFALSLLQRASPGTATRAGAPPHALSGSDLALYDLVVVGGPEDLTAREIDLLQGFVRDRGGAVAFIATRRPDGGYSRLLGDVTFEERVTEQANGSRRCRWLGDSSVRDPGRAPASNSPTARDSGEEPGSGRVQRATWRWHDHLFWCARCVAVSRIGSGCLRPVLAIRAVRGCVFGPAAIERTARSWPRTGRPASACPGDASRDGTVRHTSGDRDEDRRTCRRTRSARRRPVEVVAVDRTRCVRGRMDADSGWPVHGDRRERRAAGGRRRAGSQSRRPRRWC